MDYIPFNGTEFPVILKNEKGKQSFLAVPIKKDILRQDPPYSLLYFDSCNVFIAIPMCCSVRLKLKTLGVETY